jgi:hypothetical protein
LELLIIFVIVKELVAEKKAHVETKAKLEEMIEKYTKALKQIEELTKQLDAYRKGASGPTPQSPQTTKVIHFDF